MKKSLIIALVIFTFMLLAWCDVNEEVGKKIENPYNQTQEQDVRDFWLDFSDYEYYWYDDVWHMREYFTWSYNESWLPDWKWTIYYENGQIAQEWYFENWLEQWVFTWYSPTYWNYIYYLSWDYIHEEYIEIPKWLAIEKNKPTWWLAYVQNFENWVKNWLYVDYLSQRNIETNENIVNHMTYFENWEELWTEIWWKKYTAEDLDKMSEEEFDILFSIPDIEEWYYYLIWEKAPLAWWIEEEWEILFAPTDKKDEYISDDWRKIIWSNPVFSWDILLQHGQFIIYYMNWNIESFTNHIWYDKDKIILDGNQRTFGENGNTESLSVYSDWVKNWVHVIYNTNWNIDNLQFYRKWKLKYDMSDEKDNKIVTIYNDILIQSMSICTDATQYVFNVYSDENVATDKVFLQIDEAINSCETSLDIVNYIWDYEWDSSLVESCSKLLGLEIDYLKLFKEINNYLRFDYKPSSDDIVKYNDMTNELYQIENDLNDMFEEVEIIQDEFAKKYWLKLN